MPEKCELCGRELPPSDSKRYHDEARPVVHDDGTLGTICARCAASSMLKATTRAHRGTMRWLSRMGR
jgi:hypothetical protein